MLHIDCNDICEIVGDLLRNAGFDIDEEIFNEDTYHQRIAEALENCTIMKLRD